MLTAFFVVGLLLMLPDGLARRLADILLTGMVCVAIFSVAYTVPAYLIGKIFGA